MTIKKRPVFAHAKDYILELNDNIITNALRGRDSFTALPSLYQRAYIIVNETGEVPVSTGVTAPAEGVRT